MPAPRRRRRGATVGLVALTLAGLAAPAGAAAATGTPSVTVAFPNQAADSQGVYTAPANTATTFTIAVANDASSSDTVTLDIGAGVPLPTTSVAVSCGGTTVTFGQSDAEDLEGTTAPLGSGTQTLTCTLTPATAARGTLTVTAAQTATVTSTSPGVYGTASAQVPKATPYLQAQYPLLDRASTKSMYYVTANSTGGGSPLQVLDGTTGDVLLGGDFAGSGDDYPVVYRPSNSTFYISQNGQANSNGSIQIVNSTAIHFGSAGDVPLVGNFVQENPQGAFDTVAVYRPSNQTFYIMGASPSGLHFGSHGDIPLVGNWTGSPGGDSIGVYRPSNSTFYLFNPDTNPPSVITTRLGSVGDQPIVGDWNGQGETLIGIHRGNAFYLGTSNTAATVSPPFNLGSASDTATSAWSFTPSDLRQITGAASAPLARRSALRVARRTVPVRSARSLP